MKPITDPITRRVLLDELARRRAAGDEQAATMIECDLYGKEYPENVFSLSEGTWNAKTTLQWKRFNVGLLILIAAYTISSLHWASDCKFMGGTVEGNPFFGGRCVGLKK